MARDDRRQEKRAPGNPNPSSDVGQLVNMIMSQTQQPGPPQSTYGGGSGYDRGVQDYMKQMTGEDYSGPMDRRAAHTNMRNAQETRENVDINALIQMMAGGGGAPVDPNNQQVPGMPPLPMEDAEQDGYWDAQNRGNGRGDSFQMQGGKQIPADPVGMPPEIQQLLQMIGPAAGSNDSGDGYYDVGPQQIPPEMLKLLTQTSGTGDIARNLSQLQPDDTGSIDFRDVGPEQVPPEMLKLLTNMSPEEVDSVIQTMMQVEGIDSEQKFDRNSER